MKVSSRQLSDGEHLSKDPLKSYLLDFKQRLDTEQGPHSIYEDYPPYPDAFLSTYRSLDRSKWSMTKV